MMAELESKDGIFVISGVVPGAISVRHVDDVGASIVTIELKIPGGIDRFAVSDWAVELWERTTQFQEDGSVLTLPVTVTLEPDARP